MGCLPDVWVTVSRPDAGDALTDAPIDVLSTGDHPAAFDAGADTDPARDETGACAGDAQSACGCRSGYSRCGVSCADGPRNLYRGEGDGRDGAGSQHATQGNAGFADGRFGQAFAFGGALEQQYVTLPPGVLDLGDGDFTVSLWFASTRHGNLLSKRASCWGGAASTGLDLRLTDAGGLILELWTTRGFLAHRSPLGLNDGAWHHVAILREGATLRLRVDGAVVGTGELIGAFRDPTATPVYLGVGRCVPGAPGSNGSQDGSTWLDGRVDEVAVVSRALSETELLAVVQGRCTL